MSLFHERIKNLVLQPQWNIGVVNAPVSKFLDQTFVPEISWLPIFDKNKFIADPFGVEVDGTVYIFCEYFDFRRLKGDIACITYANGGFSKPRIVMQGSVHMSFPYLLQYQGVHFCLPSMARSGRVVLYREKNFPYQWQEEMVLLDSFSGADNCLFFHDGYWWIFNTNLEERPYSEMYIWYSKELTGRWRPHEQSPAKKDIRCSRPAGGPFYHQGRLYRPAMDNSRGYGTRLAINRIIKLNPREFFEETVNYVEADQSHRYSHGVHTLSGVSNFRTLVDGKAKKVIAAATIAKMKRTLGLL